MRLKSVGWEPGFGGDRAPDGAGGPARTCAAPATCPGPGPPRPAAAPRSSPRGLTLGPAPHTCASAGLGVPVGDNGRRHLPRRAGAGPVPGTRRAPRRGQRLAVPTSLRGSGGQRRELRAGWVGPHHVASAAMETACAWPPGTCTTARGPGAEGARACAPTIQARRAGGAGPDGSNH